MNSLSCGKIEELWKAGERKVKVEKQKFDTILAKLVKAKPEPRMKIKTTGKRTAKPILPK